MAIEVKFGGLQLDEHNTTAGVVRDVVRAAQRAVEILPRPAPLPRVECGLVVDGRVYRTTPVPPGDVEGEVQRILARFERGHGACIMFAFVMATPW